MEIFRDINKIRKKKFFVTVGVFDGLHLGHRHILRALVKSANQHNVESAVITFCPHPLAVLKDNIRILLIDTLYEKTKLIEKQDIDNLIILPFTKEFASLASKDFMQKYLKEALDISGLLVGYDHKFGKDKLHDFNILSSYAKELNFDITKIDAFTYETETISSTIIRKAILNGEIERANKFLSRKFSLSGKVVNGRKIGRQMGFPTANINIDDTLKIIPQEGVYAVEAEFDKEIIRGMLNIGKRPTFEEEENNATIELHLFDFKGNLYDKNIKISFCKRIRDEMKFSQINDLIKQLRHDEKNVRNYFKYP